MESCRSRDAFNRPTGIAFAANGNYFISDGYINSRVVRFGRTGSIRNSGDVREPVTANSTWCTISPSIRRDASTWPTARTGRVQVFDQEGNFLAKWPDVGSPWGLSYVARENAMYMCDGYNNRIVKLNTEGQVLGVLGSYGKTWGTLDFPHNIAVDSTGAWRVQKFAK